MQASSGGEAQSRLEQYYQRQSRLISASQKIDMYQMALKSGRGAVLTDVDDREYIDFSSGDCVANIGYCHPYLVKAVSEQIGTLNHATSVRYPSEPNLALASRLVEVAPIDPPAKVLFAISGTDACEAAYKLMKAYSGRPRVMSNMGAVHGFALGTLSMTAFRGFSEYLTLSDGTKVPYPYCYRCPMGTSRQECSLDCLSYVEDYVFNTVCEPEQVAGWIIEAAQGDAGYIVPPPEYMQGVERICRKHGILLVLDEILLGLGRSGKFFAFQHFGLHPDLIVLGKALGAGIPLGAVVGRADIMDCIPGKHISSTTGSLVATAAGVAVLDAIRDDGLVANAEEVGGYLLGLLKELEGKYRSIGNVRGLGLGIGVEVVDPKDGKTIAPSLALEIAKGALGNGVLMSVFGMHFNVLMVAPPLVLDREQARLGVERLEQAISEVESRSA